MRSLLGIQLLSCAHTRGAQRYFSERERDREEAEGEGERQRIESSPQRRESSPPARLLCPSAPAPAHPCANVVFSFKFSV